MTPFTTLLHTNVELASCIGPVVLGVAEKAKRLRDLRRPLFGVTTNDVHLQQYIIGEWREEARLYLNKTRFPSSALLPFFGGGFPLKYTTEKSWYPYSNLSSGGPRRN